MALTDNILGGGGESFGNDSKEAQIRMLLAQLAGGQQGQASNVPYSNLPFSGLPQLPRSSMFDPNFLASMKTQVMGAPEPMLARPEEPPRMERLKVGESMESSAFDDALRKMAGEKKDVPKSNLDRITDALKASRNAMAALYEQPSGVAETTRGTQGYAPGSKFFAAKPRKRVLSPMEAPDTGEEVFDMQGVPAGYFERLTGQESGGDDTAVNKLSGASGRYQFMPGTVVDLVKRVPGLAEKINDKWRTDPTQQQALLEAYTQLSLDALKPIVKDRMPTYGELYAMHFFGHGGGKKALTNPDTPLGELFPDVVFEQNPTLNRNMTGAQFVRYINDSWK